MTRRHQQREHGTSPMPSQRQLRVGELVRHALADMLTRDRFQTRARVITDLADLPRVVLELAA